MDFKDYINTVSQYDIESMTWDWYLSYLEKNTELVANCDQSQEPVAKCDQSKVVVKIDDNQQLAVTNCDRKTI